MFDKKKEKTLSEQSLSIIPLNHLIPMSLDHKTAEINRVNRK